MGNILWQYEGQEDLGVSEGFSYSRNHQLAKVESKSRAGSIKDAEKHFG